MSRLLAVLLTFHMLGSGGSARADVAFAPVSLPVAHEYSGGWTHFVGGGVAVFDCDGDARLDLFAAGGSAPALLLRNTSDKGALSFETTDFPEIVETTGAYPFDVDGDDLLDLVVLRAGENLLLRGDGTCQFTPAPAAWNFDGGTEWTTAFSATFEAGQDWPTFVFGNYVDETDPDGPFEACDVNHLMRPAGRAFGPRQPLEPGFCALSMLISDWKRDGRPELRISNDRQYYVSNGREQMFALDPLREYTEAEGWPTMKLWGMGIASRDITGDGLPEVALTSMGDQPLMLNRGQGVMEPAPYDMGTYATTPYMGDDGRPSTGWQAQWGDVDNDGRDDLFIAKGNVDQMPSNAMADPNNLLMQQADGRFAERGDTAGVGSTARARGAALVDFDGDGLLDLVVNNRRAPLEVWQNVTEGAGHWLAVDLRQPGPNTRAIGAFIEVRSGDRLQTREITSGGGHASGSLGPEHFGLGADEQADLRVIWPDGQTGDWQRVAADESVRITRTGGAP